jgi:hypothetical protein
VQFALSHYYSVYQIVNSKWSKEKAKDKIQFHLSKSMGVVVTSIERDAPLDPTIFDEIKKFKERRNWLAHDFDEDSTPFLSQGERFDHYIDVMEYITIQAHNIMQKLNEIGENLIPVQKK